MTPAAFAACLLLSAQTYQVPPAVLIGIMRVEGGRIGQEVLNTNGTYDLGPMQINTSWLPRLADHWRVDEHQARTWVRDDGCTNVGVAAWIMRQGIDEAKTLVGGIGRYHSPTGWRGREYAEKVVATMRRYGLIAPAVPPPAPQAVRDAAPPSTAGLAVTQAKAAQPTPNGAQVQTLAQGAKPFTRARPVLGTPASQTVTP